MNTSRFLSMLVFSYNSCLYKIKERERLFFLKKKNHGRSTLFEVSSICKFDLC